jgi:hypothetical protein
MKTRLRSLARFAALAALLALPGFALEDAANRAEESPAAGTSALDARASQFQSSTKDSVALDVDVAGRAVAVWNSRRQQEGTYGIYARRFEADGSVLGEEVQINATTVSHQTAPCVALDADGTAWFAWISHGQDGDLGAVIARRFDAALGTASRELQVNELGAGDQREVRIASDDSGNAVVVWTSTVDDSSRREVFARRLAPAGSARGASFRVSASQDGSNNSPSLAMAADGSFVVLWARVDAAGLPEAIFGRAFTSAGEPREGAAGREFRISTSVGAAGIEPALACIDGGRFVACWFEQHEGDWRVAHRGFELSADGELRLSAARTLPELGRGHVSGATIAACSDGGFALAWNHYGIAPEQHADLYLATFDAQGEPERAPFVATRATEGHQRIAPADGARMLHYGADGRLVVAWSGDAGLGDQHGAHVSWHAGQGQVLVAAGTPLEATVRFDEPARPHVPPTYTPGQGLQPIPFNPTSHALTGLVGFQGISNTGWTPPDPDLAVGPNHLVQMTNGAIAFFDKDGTPTFQTPIEGGGGFWGAQGATGFVFDPEPRYDPHSDRFFAMCCERASNGKPYFLLAVSDDSNPNGAWHKYRIDVQAAAGDTDIDSPNMGIDAQAVYLTADFFGPDKFLVYVIEKAPLLSGGAINAKSTVLNGRQSMGLPVSYSGAPRQYMVWSPEGGTSTDITIYAVQNPLTSPSLVSATVSVPSFTQPENPPQQGTSTRPETFESRFWSCIYRNGSLWATHHVDSSRVRQRWYEIDMANWPVSGTPSLVQSGEIDPGAGIRTYFGSIAVDDAGNMGLCFARSASNEFISMGYAWRAAGDALGTTRPVVSAMASNSADTSGRWGDYSGIGPDPSAGSTFWAVHEYRTSSWKTWIQSFTATDPLENFCSTSPNSVGPGATISATGTTSVSANDLTLSAVGAPSNVQGLFFFGPNETQVPLGNGWLCVSGPIQRLPVAPTNGTGSVSYLVDNQGPQVGGAFVSGSIWKFQYWYRDQTVGLGFNLTDGLSVTFQP